MKKLIVVSSTNPVKIQAVRLGFERVFQGDDFSIEGIQVPSGVANQPFSDQETLTGALNRVDSARKERQSADFWVGIEGGISPLEEDMAAFAWVAIRSRSLLGKARTGTFFLPAAVAKLVHQGMELGQADDVVFQKQNSKQANGAIGILTNNLIDRASLYSEAVVLALVPFLNPSLYDQAQEE